MFSQIMNNKIYLGGIIILVLAGAVYLLTCYIKGTIRNEFISMKKKEKKLEQKRFALLKRAELKQKQEQMQKEADQHMYGNNDGDMDSYVDPMGGQQSPPMGMTGFRDDLQENITMRDMIDRSGCQYGSCM